jgi:hypothetical protein
MSDDIPDMSEVLDALVLCQWLSSHSSTASEEELCTSLPDCSFDVLEFHGEAALSSGGPDGDGSRAEPKADKPPTPPSFSWALVRRSSTAFLVLHSVTDHLVWTILAGGGGTAAPVGVLPSSGLACLGGLAGPAAAVASAVGRSLEGPAELGTVDRLVLCGHGVGGAMGTAVAAELAAATASAGPALLSSGGQVGSVPDHCAVYTFGAPAVLCENRLNYVWQRMNSRHRRRRRRRSFGRGRDDDGDDDEGAVASPSLDVHHFVNEDDVVPHLLLSERWLHGQLRGAIRGLGLDRSSSTSTANSQNSDGAADAADADGGGKGQRKGKGGASSSAKATPESGSGRKDKQSESSATSFRRRNKLNNVVKALAEATTTLDRRYHDIY